MIGKFVTVPLRSVIDKNLSHLDKAILQYLCMRSDNKTAESYPSQSRISIDLNISTRTLIRSLKKLEELSYVAVKTRYKKMKGGRTSNLYKVLYDTDDDWIEIDDDHQKNEENCDVQLSDTDVTNQNQLGDTDVTNAGDTDVTNAFHSNITKLSTNYLNKEKLKKEKSPKEEAEQIKTDFEEWWLMHPKQVGKQPSWIKYSKLRKEGITAEMLKNGLERYLLTKEVRDGYILNPLTWLNQARWEDQHPSPADKKHEINHDKTVCSCGKHTGMGVSTPAARANNYAWSRKNERAEYKNEIKAWLESYEQAHGPVTYTPKSI